MGFLSGLFGAFLLSKYCFPCGSLTRFQQTGVYPLPLGRGVCKTKSKQGRARDRKPFMHRVYSAQRRIETMVSEGARPWGRGRFEFADSSKRAQNQSKPYSRPTQTVLGNNRNRTRSALGQRYVSFLLCGAHKQPIEN